MHSNADLQWMSVQVVLKKKCKYGTIWAIRITPLLLPWWYSDFESICPSRTLRPRMQWRWLWGAQPAAVCHVFTLFSQVQEQHKVGMITQWRVQLVDPECSVCSICWYCFCRAQLMLACKKTTKCTWLWPHIMVVKMEPECTPTHLESYTSCPLCALVRGCPIGCVYQSVPGDSGATAGAVRGATPPVRAALGVAVTSAPPVNLVITWLRGKVPAQPSVEITTTSTTVGFLASNLPLWISGCFVTFFVIILNNTEGISSSEPLSGLQKSSLETAAYEPANE